MATFCHTALSRREKIIRLHTEEVRAIDGIVEIFTTKNCPSVAWLDIKYADMDAPRGNPFSPLQGDGIIYNGQPIAWSLPSHSKWQARGIHVKN